MNKKTISVIMSIKDNEETLGDSIQSVLSQTYEDFEFLILDDNSVDNSFNILKQNENKDSRIKIFKNKHTLGLTKSLNYLIKQAKGSFIARQDGDDQSHELRFESQIKYLLTGDYHFCVSRAINIQTGETIPKLSYYVPQKYVVKIKNPFIHGTLMIDKKVLENYGCYNEKFYYAQDYKLFTDLLKGEASFKYIKKPLYYLNTLNNISNTYKVEQNYYANCVRKNLLP
tara:strand:- start:20909 stop:21592 length:684 start_codon:yes stop_codon:yes gene_type:complete